MAVALVIVFLSAIGVAIYTLITVIFWRNLSFSQPWKAAFSLSVFPVFVAAMVVNIWIVNNYAPWLMDILSGSKESGIPRAEALVAFVISTPIAALITAVWYLMFRALNKSTKVEELKLSG